MTANHYVACDLGAESGRVMLGTITDGKLSLEEIHRFPSTVTDIDGSMRWDIEATFQELKTGLRKLADQGIQPVSLSVDSWGVDYAWYAQGNPLVAMPYHYRDPRNNHTYEQALKEFGRDLIFSETGIQFMPINTLYQLIADMNSESETVAASDGFLTIADYLNYRFSGVPRAERSLASTSQVFNPQTGDWSSKLIETFGLPADKFPQVVDSGTKLGPLRDDVAVEIGLADMQVVATCSHDTGAAVAAVPAKNDHEWAYLSSGTWSLLGVELPSPVINDSVRENNFTNESGYGGTTRFLKNIVGLWLLQESRRAWAAQGNEYDYAELNRLASEAPSLRSLVAPNDPRFLAPDDMPAEIAAFCRETGQPVPETPGQFARCILESLALLYGDVLDTIETLTGRTIKTLHIVGGGSQSELLNQFSADATGRTVVAGPVEATAAGNVLIQAITMGELDSLSSLRDVVRDSFSVKTYTPQNNTSAWQQAGARLT